jgi:hypothetical protein
MARYRSKRAKALPPLLVRLIEAAEDSAFDLDNSVSPDVLRSFGALALVAVPRCGLFVPNDNDICMAIDRVAKLHLGLEEAQRAFREAVGAVQSFAERDAIESTYLQIRSATDEAYFYAGLAFGVTLADFS